MSDLVPPSLPVVENTPTVNDPNAQASTVAPVSTTTASVPAGLTEERFAILLGDLEKRLSQSAKDSAKAAVHKALGVTIKPPAAQPAITPTPAVPTTPITTNTPLSTSAEVVADPVLTQAYSFLQVDNVDVADSVDPIVLEAYKIQAKAGIHLKATDPELASIDGSSVLSYLTTTARAVEAVKARMIEEGTYPGQDIVADNALVLTPGLVTGKASTRVAHEGKSGSETLDMFFNRGH